MSAPANSQITLSLSQQKILQWLAGKSPVSVTEAMEQGLGRMGLSNNTVRVSLDFMATAGLVRKHKSTSVVKNGFGLAAAAGRKINVIKYSVKE